MKAVNKDDIVFCPRCDIDLYRVTRDVLCGEMSDADQFKGIWPAPDPINGTEFSCLECLKPLSYMGVPYTRRRFP